MDQDIPLFGEDESHTAMASAEDTGPRATPAQDDPQPEPPPGDGPAEENTSPSAVDQLSDWVGEHPLVALAAALGVGLVVGLALARVAR